MIRDLLVCEHVEEGACEKCRRPKAVRAAKFVGEKVWRLLFTRSGGRPAVLQVERTLEKLLLISAMVMVEDEHEFQVMAPGGVRLSLEVARAL